MKIAAKLLATVAAAAFASSAFGASLTLTATSRSNGSNGGAYTATNSGLSTASYNYAAGVATVGAFETFCMEPTEYFNSGGTYDYTIASAAIGGANNAHGGGPGDPLSLGTTWLYSQFAQGLLSGYNYGTDAQRQASNLLLQRAFWYLEDDYGTSGQYTSAALALANPFLTLVATTLGTGATNADKLESVRANAAAGLYGVWALNLTSGSGQSLVNNQSQLYYTGNSVPEHGATIGALGFAFALLVALRRRVAGSR